METRTRQRATRRSMGWLLVYVVALVYLFFHGLALTVASVVIYYHPSHATASLSLASLLFYVITNVIEAIYIIVLLVLMWQRKRAAIANNVIYNALAVLFIIVWYFIGDKSVVGTLIELVIGVAAICYFSLSPTVRETFVNLGSPHQTEEIVR